MDFPETDQYEALLCADVPLLDVRAPVEFAQGAFPGSCNAPLMSDEERARVGTCYKHEGHDAAVALGHRLVSGDVRTARIEAWKEYCETHPGVVLYCFRGGMRSRITQQWIYEETGLLIPRISGGYKALRRFLIEQTAVLAGCMQPLILSGRTGSGKTLLLRELGHAVDLEGLANHRGSSFGRHVSPQPTQIDFEHRVAIALLKLRQSGVERVVLEDESPNIGSVHIPHPLYQRMREAPSVVLEAPLEVRVDITLREYVVDLLQEYCLCEGVAERGFVAFGEYLRNSLARIRRRLGGLAHTELLALLDKALQEQQLSLIHIRRCRRK